MEKQWVRAGKEGNGQITMNWIKKFDKSCDVLKMWNIIRFE